MKKLILTMKYTAIAVMSIAVLLVLLSASNGLILRNNLADLDDVLDVDYPELQNAIEVGKQTPLTFSIDGCYRTDTGEPFDMGVNINTILQVVNIHIKQNAGIGILLPSATAQYRLIGSYMEFEHAKGSKGLLSPLGWVIGNTGAIEGEHDFLIHTHNLTLLLFKTQC